MRPERSFHYLVLSISAAFLFVLASFSGASAATITVTNTHDSGGGSLRAAIAAANPGDTIVFSLPSPSTITLGSVLTISKNLTIKGPGADKLTINGNGDTVFDINSATVHISGLTISGAATSGPGGIDNGGTLTVTNCTFSDNSAAYGGGIYNRNGGTLKVMNCTFSGNTADSYGGGISNDGTLRVTDSTFSGNSAAQGGGIDNFTGTLKVMNSTFSGNKARVGGGIDNEDTLTATNCTFSGNTADSYGGGIFNNGTSTVTNSTLSGNSAAQGGGIYKPNGSVSLRNTIVANSTGGNCYGTATITSLGHNLDDANTCGFTGTGDLINTDPDLSPLALNAPGTTETFALKSDSPAIDAGDNSNLPPTDQRGAVRIWDGDGNGTAIVDIGAYEYGAPTYVPPGVPTMNEWGMIIFVFLAGLGSVYYLKRRAES